VSTDPTFGQPAFPDHSGMTGEPGFPGQAGFPGDPAFLGAPDPLGPPALNPGFGPGLPGNPSFPGWQRRGRYGPPIGGIAGLIIMAIVIVLTVVIFISVASHGPSVSPSGPCIGGPAPGAVGQSIGNGNYKFQCVDGGSTVVHLGN